MTDPDRRAFGKRLRELRKAAGETMRDVANAIGVSTVYVSDVERGNRAPFQPEVVHQVASLLGADVAPPTRVHAGVDRGPARGSCYPSSKIDR